MTTANKLTIMRIALIPVFLVVLYLDFAGARWWALGIFIVACLTDFVDGYIARHYNQITNFGKFMDPLADKMLVMAAAWSGKVKTASTMVCLCLMLVFQSNLLNVVCIAVIVATTVYSGIEYFAKNLDVFKEAD